MDSGIAASGRGRGLVVGYEPDHHKMMRMPAITGMQWRPRNDAQ
jgi:hypothetical protein